MATADSDDAGPELLDHYSADRREFFRKAFLTLGFNGIDGDYAEFGCYTGTTFRLAYEESRRAHRHLAFLDYAPAPRFLWALDSFQGLPAGRGSADEHPFWKEGALATPLPEFHEICRRAGIPRFEYEVVAGFYEQTLTRPRADLRLPENIALAFIDCDLYSSIAAVLSFLIPRAKHGMVLAFDDYFVYSATQVSGARRACVEAFEDHPEWRLLPYIQFAWGGMSFVLESKKLLK